MDDRIPLLALLREDEPIDRLPEDPRRFMAAPMTKAHAVFAVVGTGIVTVVAVALYITRVLLREPVGVSVAVGLFVAVMLALGWIAVIDGLRGMKRRRGFFREYARMCAAGPRPRTGTVTRSETTQSDSGTLEKVWIGIALDSGGMLQAKRHPRRALYGADGGDIRRNSHHAPQHGDALTVFDDPAGILPPLVLTNRRPR